MADTSADDIRPGEGQPQRTGEQAGEGSGADLTQNPAFRTMQSKLDRERAEKERLQRELNAARAQAAAAEQSKNLFVHAVNEINPAAAEELSAMAEERERRIRAEDEVKSYRQQAEAAQYLISLRAQWEQHVAQFGLNPYEPYFQEAINRLFQGDSQAVHQAIRNALSGPAPQSRTHQKEAQGDYLVLPDGGSAVRDEDRRNAEVDKVYNQLRQGMKPRELTALQKRTPPDIYLEAVARYTAGKKSGV